MDSACSEIHRVTVTFTRDSDSLQPPQHTNMAACLADHSYRLLSDIVSVCDSVCFRLPEYCFTKNRLG